MELSENIAELVESTPTIPPPEEDAGVFAALLAQGIHALGEGYMQGLWKCESLDHVMYRVFTENAAPLSWWGRLGYLKDARIRRYVFESFFWNQQRGVRGLRVGKEHYDLGNDLFAAMLDSSMTYTCGYWHGVTKLEEAQRQKLDLICQKLQLEKGMRVFDIGCGWGNFAQYAALEYGVQVTGVTISKEQAALARQRCKDLPVEIILGDYRTVPGTFDRIVSIEMIEAIGKKNLNTFFSTVFDRLLPGGLFLLQAISAETVSPYSQHRLDEFLIWILTYIFPNGYLPTITELVKPGRMRGNVEDIHNFGPDYELTLLAWAANFERAWPALRSGSGHTRYGEQFYRMWRFYLYSCAALFRARITQVYQIVYSKAGAAPGTYRFIR